MSCIEIPEQSSQLTMLQLLHDFPLFQFISVNIDIVHFMTLQVKDPSGAQIHDSRDKISDKFEFVVQKRGLHRFCFTNKSPYHETIDFDVHVGHFSYFDQHAKDGNNHHTLIHFAYKLFSVPVVSTSLS